MNATVVSPTDPPTTAPSEIASPTTGPTTAPRPNLLVIGAARAGSTFLVNQLVRHDDIAASSPKETHFLSLGDELDGFTGPGDEATINPQIIHQVEDWEAGFLGAHQAKIRVDASVSMLYHGNTTIERARHYLGDDVRVLVVLRDPVERAYSAFKYLQNRGYERLDSFEDALAAEAERKADGWHHLWHYASMSRYAEQLVPFIEAYGDRLRAVSHDDLTTDTEATIGDIVSWLGLNPIAVDVDDQAVNASGELRSSTVQNLLTTCRDLPWLQTAVKRIVPFELRERVRSMNLRPSEVPHAARQHLLGELETDMSMLRDLLAPDSWPGWLATSAPTAGSREFPQGTPR